MISPFYIATDDKNTPSLPPHGNIGTSLDGRVVSLALLYMSYCQRRRSKRHPIQPGVHTSPV